MVTVIGKLKDTLPYVGRVGYNVLQRRDDWTPAMNRAWLRAAVDRGDQFLIVSSRADGFFAVELCDLCELLTKGKLSWERS